MRRGLLDEVHDRHRRHRDPRDRPRAGQRQRTGLRRTDDTIDQDSRQVRRNQADERDDGRGGHAERQLTAVRLQVAQQAPDHGRLPSRHQGLRLANRTSDALGIDAIGVHARHVTIMPRDLLFEHEPDVLERAALAMRVAQQHQRGLARRAEDRQRVGRQSGRLTDRFDIRPRDASDLPAWIRPLCHREMPLAQGQPRLGEPQALIEIGERVQLHGRALPGVLDLPPQLERKPRWLCGVARDDVVVEMLLLRAHVRDPRIVCNRTAPQVSGSTRKAGSRRELDPIDF